MKKFITLLILIVIVLAAVFLGSPYYTVYQLKNAYDAHDGDAVTQYIDFEQLQPNIQNQLTQRFATTLTQYPLVAQLGGDALQQTANSFIQQATRQAVNADNVSSLINTQGQANKATKEFAASWAIASNKIELQGLIQQLIVQRGDLDAVMKNQVQTLINQQADELEQRAQSGEDSPKPDLSYCGINCFTVSGKLKGYPVTVEMAREGLIDWKIVDVVLP